jgi:Membrane dipeptidase (Peptidase family M19)
MNFWKKIPEKATGSGRVRAAKHRELISPAANFWTKSPEKGPPKVCRAVPWGRISTAAYFWKNFPENRAGSHLNERGFWDVAATRNATLVATISNAHALSPHSRNLTDQQLAAIRETGGLVGVNFATSLLRPDGRRDTDTPTDLVVEHVEHMLKHVGEDGVGLGSPKSQPE